MAFVAVCAVGIAAFIRCARRQSRPVEAATCWIVIGLGVALLAVGAENSLYFEPTTEALHRASRGHRVAALGLLVTLVGSVAEFRRRRR